MTSQKIKNAVAADLLEILTRASKQKKMPLKFCIARNIKNLQPSVQEYLDAKEVLFKESALLDDDGNAVIKEEFREAAAQAGGRISYGAFEYVSEDAQKTFVEKLKELNNEEVEIEFAKESASRRIKISMSDGTYSDATIQDVLEDPNNEITSALITLFMEYFLEV